MRLLTKATLIVLGGAFVSIVFASYFFLVSTKSVLEVHIQEKQKELGNQTLDKIDRLLFQYYIGIQNIAEERGHIQGALGGEFIELRTIERRMKELQFLTGPWDALKIIDTKGAIIVSTAQNKSGNYLLKESTESATALYSALGGNIYYSDFVFSGETGRPTMIFAAPIRDQEKSSHPIIGAVLGYVAWPAIAELVENFDSTSEFTLYTHDGVLIATNQRAPVGLFVKNEEVAHVNEKAFFDTHTADEMNEMFKIRSESLTTHTHSVGHLAYKGNRWSLFIETPKEIAFAPATTAARKVALLTLPVVLLVALLTLIFLRRFILHPITDFMLITRTIAGGDFSGRVPVFSEDEIGQLSTAFNTMAEKLQDLYAGMDQKIKEKTSELNAKATESERSKLAVLNLLDDIETEKKKVDALVVSRTQELTEEKARLLASINSIPFGFLIANNEGRVLLMNGVLMELFKFDEKNGITTIKDITKHLDKDLDLEKMVQQCLTGKKVCELQEILFESRFLRGIIAPIIAWGASSETIGYTLLFEDITEAKVLEKSRDEFFAVASHELRTPLTAIRGNAAMLQDVYKEKFVDKDMAEMVDDIYKASVRLIAIVADFLDVSRLEQGRVVIENTKFPVAEPIKRVMGDLMKSAEEKGLFFTFKQPDGLPMVFGDKGRLGQVMMNLLGNALKFSHGGAVAIEALKEGEFVKVLVSDTGIGIAPKDQALLFHKFQQVGESAITRDVTQSTGLGLYISKLIIEKAGGTMGLLKSAVGEGSTFYFTIPIAP